MKVSSFLLIILVSVPSVKADHYAFASPECASDPAAIRLKGELATIESADRFRPADYESYSERGCLSRIFWKSVTPGKQPSADERANYFGNLLLAERSSPGTPAHAEAEAALKKWSREREHGVRLSPVERLLLKGNFVDFAALAGLMHNAVSIRLSSPVSLKVPLAQFSGESGAPAQEIEVTFSSADLETLSDRYLQYQLSVQKLNARYDVFDAYAAALLLGQVPADLLRDLARKKVFYVETPSRLKNFVSIAWPFARAVAYRTPYTAAGAIGIDFVSSLILTAKAQKQERINATRLLR